MVKTAKNTIAKIFQGYLLIIVTSKNLSIAKELSVKLPDIFANIFQHKFQFVFVFIRMQEYMDCHITLVGC